MLFFIRLYNFSVISRIFYNIIERILPLPASDKIRNKQLKALLLPVAQRLLPRAVWDRPKQGFHVPFDLRLAGPWRPAVNAALDWGESNLDFFDYKYLRRIQSIPGIGTELWNPVVLLSWCMAHSIKL